MIKHVERVLNKLSSGATEPVEGIIDGQRAIIKTFNNRWSNKILINEYICYRLANNLDMSIPISGICNIDSNTIIEKELEEELDYDQTIDGYGFYSKRIEKVTKFSPNINVVKLIENKLEINKIVLFDHLIFNNDRHDGNLLISLKESKIYIIDHSHVFNLTYRWNAQGLEKLIDNDYSSEEIMINNLDLVYQPFIDLKIITKENLIKESNNFKKIINRELLEEIVSEIPEEWISNRNDVNKLIEYILYRLNNLNKFIEIIINYLI